MTEAAPYLFDRRFESPTRGGISDEAAAANKMQEEYERKMAEACVTAFEEGYEAGKAETLEGVEEATRLVLEKLVASVERLQGSVGKECGNIRVQAVELGKLAANMLADEMIARSPISNIEALFLDVMEHIEDAPHVAITVNDSLSEVVRDRITVLASERGYAGKIVVLGDPETQKGDASLQWADGGMAVNTQSTRDEISRIIKRHLDQVPRPAEAAAQPPQQAGTGSAQGETQETIEKPEDPAAPVQADATPGDEQ